MKLPLSIVAIIVLSVAFSHSTWARPWLTADPQCFDPTGANATCADSYEVSDDDGATWSILDSDVTDTSITIWHDLAVYAPGGHNLLVHGVNTWGVSDDVPFDFTAGVPAAPGGLRVVSPPDP